MTTPMLADVILKYKERKGRSYRDIERLARGQLSWKTVYSWAQGQTRRPRAWQDLIHFATALGLTEAEADEVLAAAGHASIVELRVRSAAPADTALLVAWAKPDAVFQAPREEPVFVGRESEKERAIHALSSGERICVLQGMAGVGKSTLADRIAHEKRADYPDGVLWATLSNTDSALSVDGLDGLAGVLNQFAAAVGHDISHHDSIARRVEELRGILAAKRSLVVLDGVEQSEDLFKLIPSHGLCAVLITTQNRTLSTNFEAVAIDIHPFNRVEAMNLLIGILGQTAVNQEAHETARLFHFVEGHPLAMRLIANTVKNTRSLTLAELVVELEDTAKRLESLDALASNRIGIRASFEVSFRHLSENAQTLFASFSLFAARNVSLDAAMAATTLPSTTTKLALAELESFSFIQSSAESMPDVPQTGLDHSNSTLSEDSYQIHALLHSFARLKLIDGAATAQRCYDFYLQMLQANTSKRVEREWENIVGFAETIDEYDRIDFLAELIGQLSSIDIGGLGFLDKRGYWQEGLEWTTRLLDDQEQHWEKRPLEHAQLLLKNGTFAYRCGKADLAKTSLNVGYEILDNLSQ